MEAGHPVADACAPGFIDQYAEICRAAAPLVRLVCDVLALPD